MSKVDLSHYNYCHIRYKCFNNVTSLLFGFEKF